MAARAERAYDFGPYRLLPAKRTLLRDREPVTLTAKAFETLLFLVEQRDRVVTKEELLRHVWADVIVEEGNLTQQIFLLRKALDDSADGQRYIATIPRVGYRFVADVVVEADAEPVRRTPPKRGRIMAAAVGLAAAALAVFLVPRGDRAASTPPRLTFAQVTADPGIESFPSLSPDGQFVIYAQGPIDYEGESDIHLRRVGLDRSVNLTPNSPGADMQPALSADGEHIAFRSARSGGGIFRMRITGESVQLVTDTGYNPAWSPDGKRLVYSTESTAASPYARGRLGELWTVDIASGTRTRIATGDAMKPHWSPHGHRIAYWGTNVSLFTSAIYTVPATGGEPTRVAGGDATTAGEFYWSPVWSPDGRYLYFSSNRAGTMNVWRVPIDERSGQAIGELEPITTPTTFGTHVSFAARDGRFAFASLPIRAAIQRVTLDPVAGKTTGEPVAVTKDSRGWLYAEPSPDGTALAFQSAISNKQEDIFVSAADGSGLRQLTDDRAADRAARWSPDGRHIAFYSMRGGNWNIWIINADGSGLRQVTDVGAGRQAIFPAWSPDGRMSAMLGGRGAFIFDPDETWSDQRVQPLPPVDAHHNFQAWSWSRDGQFIAGSNAPGGGIVIYSLVRRTYESITTFGSIPVWLGDNRRLIFAFQNRLFIVDRTTKAATQLISFGEGRIQPAAGGGFSLSKDGRAIYATPIVREGDVWLATVK